MVVPAFAAELRLEAHRANLETGEGAVYTTPAGGDVYDPSTGSSAATAGVPHPVVVTPGSGGTTRQEGTTIQLEDRLFILTGLAGDLEPQEGGRLTTRVEDFAVVAVQRHAVAGYSISHTVRVRDA